MVLSGLLALLLVLTSLSAPSSACSCGKGYETPAEELAVRDVVFAGRVTELVEGFHEYDEQHLEFEVSAVWKGDLQETVRVCTPTLGARSGYAFDLYSQYLVYGDWQDDGIVRVHICSGTHQIEDVSEGIAELGAPVSASPSQPPEAWSMKYSAPGR